MGLRSLFQRAAKTAFRVAGDVPVWCTYRQDASDELDSVAPFEFPVQVLFGRLTWEQMIRTPLGDSQDILPGDCTATIRSDTMLVTPERGDTLSLLDGTVYRIISWHRSMGDILLTLHLRAM